MSTAANVSQSSLLTVEQFAERPDPGYPEELVKGRVVALPPTKRRHGQICSQAVYLLRRFLEDHDLGHVLSNDAGIITQRDPDTVRGADVAYYSYEKLPKGRLPANYGPEVPEVVFEVLSPSDRWPQVLAKVAEYLAAGVVFAVVLDDARQMAQVFGAEGTIRILGAEEELTLPGVLEGFRVKVERFFE